MQIDIVIVVVVSTAVAAATAAAATTAVVLGFVVVISNYTAFGKKSGYCKAVPPIKCGMADFHWCPSARPPLFGHIFQTFFEIGF